jgi:hypothetical protein
MRFLVRVEADVLVDVQTGGALGALQIARVHVANDWLLREREGAMKDVGHYMVKGLSAEVKDAVPYVGSRRLSSEESAEGEEIW